MLPLSILVLQLFLLIFRSHRKSLLLVWIIRFSLWLMGKRDRKGGLNDQKDEIFFFFNLCFRYWQSLGQKGALNFFARFVWLIINLWCRERFVTAKDLLLVLSSNSSFSFVNFQFFLYLPPSFREFGGNFGVTLLGDLKFYNLIRSLDICVCSIVLNYKILGEMKVCFFYCGSVSWCHPPLSDKQKKKKKHRVKGKL